MQLDLLGIISSITTEENFGLDAAYYYTSYKGDIHDNWKGTVAPGLHLGYLNYALTDQSAFDAIVGLRMGAQALKEMGVGIYVVPGIGIRNVSMRQALHGDERQHRAQRLVDGRRRLASPKGRFLKNARRRVFRPAGLPEGRAPSV